jgi:hypothetical protein
MQSMLRSFSSSNPRLHVADINKNHFSKEILLQQYQPTPFFFFHTAFRRVWFTAILIRLTSSDYTLLYITLKPYREASKEFLQKNILTMRSISFSDENQVFLIPRLPEAMKEKLFYQERDIWLFQYEAALERAGWSAEKSFLRNLWNQLPGSLWAYGIGIAILCWSIRK